MMGQLREDHDDLEGALACFREGVQTLGPAFQRLPQAFAPLMQALVAESIRVLEALGREQSPPSPAGGGV